MKENKKKDNSLIKRKNLIYLLKKQGIKRISPESLISIENFIKRNLENFGRILRQEIIINGRKTLKTQDVEKSINKMEKEEEFEL